MKTRKFDISTATLHILAMTFMLMYPVQFLDLDFELCQQGLALLALIPIWMYKGRQGHHSKPFQYICYAFYPVHMFLLVVILNFLNR